MPIRRSQSRSPNLCAGTPDMHPCPPASRDIVKVIPADGARLTVAVGRLGTLAHPPQARHTRSPTGSAGELGLVLPGRCGQAVRRASKERAFEWLFRSHTTNVDWTAGRPLADTPGSSGLPDTVDSVGTWYHKHPLWPAGRRWASRAHVRLNRLLGRHRDVRRMVP